MMWGWVLKLVGYRGTAYFRKLQRGFNRLHELSGSKTGFPCMHACMHSHMGCAGHSARKLGALEQNGSAADVGMLCVLL